VKWQEKAIGLLDSEEKKAYYQKRLELYRGKKPYREESKP
jgi:hypothetical protein